MHSRVASTQALPALPAEAPHAAYRQRPGPAVLLSDPGRNETTLFVAVPSTVASAVPPVARAAAETSSAAFGGALTTSLSGATLFAALALAAALGSALSLLGTRLSSRGLNQRQLQMQAAASPAALATEGLLRYEAQHMYRAASANSWPAEAGMPPTTTLSPALSQLGGQEASSRHPKVR